MRLRILRFALTLIVTACASTTQSKTGQVDIAPGVMLVLPDRPPFGAEANVVQLGQAVYQDRNTAFQAVISSSREAMTLVMTAPAGPRVMSFTWTDGSLETHLESIAPKGLSADHMLADIMLMYAPADLLKRQIQGAELVEGAHGSRRVVQDGKDLIVVTRPADFTGSLWAGSARLENKAFGYRLSIQSRKR